MAAMTDQFKQRSQQAAQTTVHSQIFAVFARL
jgi:hypothetical protein